MPVAAPIGGQGPLDALPVQAVLNVEICRDVTGIVIVDKAATQGGPKNGQNRSAQQRARNPLLPTICRPAHG
jgi:hypothetical protein